MEESLYHLDLKWLVFNFFYNTYPPHPPAYEKLKKKKKLYYNT